MAGSTLPAVIFITLYSSTLAPPAVTSVEEIEGFLRIHEPINLIRMKKHATLWASELLHDTDKVLTLTAAQKLRELFLLTTSLQKLTNTSTPEGTTAPPDPQLLNKQAQWGIAVKPDDDHERADNKLVRIKRNILGNILHWASGVITEEQYQQQLRIDEVLRDKVTGALARQTSFEQTMAAVFSNLTKEEESLHSYLRNLDVRHEADKLRASRMYTYHEVVSEDIDILEDLLEAVWTSKVNTRHAAYLSTKAGLPQIADFTYDHSEPNPQGVTLTYCARLYRVTEVRRMSVTAEALVVETMDKVYHLHKAYDIRHPISELEVRGTRLDCNSCANMVHTGGGNYLVVRSGDLTCREGTSPDVSTNYTAGQMISISKPTICWNQEVNVGGPALRLKDYTIDTKGDSTVDVLLLQKATKEDSKIETPAAVKATHSLLSMKLRHDIQEAKLDMQNFVVDTSLEFKKGEMTTVISWSWMAGISALILIFLILFLLKVWMSCRAAKRSAHQNVIQ